MKRLKFSEPLPEKILNGEKDTTWRINDDKNIMVNDILSLCHKDGTEFAKAEVIKVKETTLGNLTDDDKKGHESFKSDEEMYKTYSAYYKTQVTSETKVKIIKFKLL